MNGVNRGALNRKTKTMDRKWLIAFMMIIPFSLAFSGGIKVFPSQKKPVVKMAYGGLADLEISEFLRLSPKSFKEKTGQRLRIKEKIVLKFMQRSLKSKLKKNKSIDSEVIFAEANSDFNIGGFLLGFFFSLIGVLIAILFGKNAVRSALLGALCGLLVAVIAVLI